MNIEGILRYLDSGYFIIRSDQTAAAALIRQLQASNQALSEGMIKYAEELAALRRDLAETTRGQK